MAIRKGHLTLKDTSNNVLISISATSFDPTGAKAPIKRVPLMGRKDKVVSLTNNNQQYDYEVNLKGTNFKTENNTLETMKQDANSLFLYDTSNSIDGVKIKIIDWRSKVIAKTKIESAIPLNQLLERRAAENMI